MTEERTKLLNEVKAVELRMLNHKSADVRYAWGEKTQELAGDRSWDDVPDPTIFDEALRFAKEQK